MQNFDFTELLKPFFVVTVDNSSAKSHNINIDFPQFTVKASNEAEAIGKMLLSDFEYKNKPIYKTQKL
jgi:hypothetical protein